MKLFTMIFMFCFLGFNLIADEIRNEEFIYTVNGADIDIKDTDLNANCGSIFILNVDTDENLIKIIQTDTSTQKMRCMCYFDLDMKLNSLFPGIYTVEIYRREFNKFHYPVDTIYLVSKKQVVINVERALSAAEYSFVQSECLSNGVDDYENEIDDVKVYPNPSKDQASISFSISNPGRVSCVIYDLFGRELKTLNISNVAREDHIINIDSSGLQAGTYICKFFIDGNPSKIISFTVAR